MQLPGMFILGHILQSVSGLVAICIAPVLFVALSIMHSKTSAIKCVHRENALLHKLM